MSDPRTHGPDGRPRARALGIPFDGETGALNAITDVAGVEVGYTTLVRGDGDLVTGRGPVRTGVTTVFPRGRERPFESVWAGKFSFNGNGEMTGVLWVDEAGHFAGPVAITNTHSVGMTHHGVLRWLTRHPTFDPARSLWVLPVIAETCDEYLNDINGLHVTEDDVIRACDAARSGAPQEGNVGGGTGMICYEFKGGTGTASRRAAVDGETYTVGVLVQANFGKRDELSVRGVPVGRHLADNALWPGERGSIIAVAATDAPLMPVQLQRIARRVSFGVARTGTSGGDGSGDIFLAFSTGNAVSDETQDVPTELRYLRNHHLDPLFRATVEATEEAILNAIVAAETMTGQGGHTVHAIDHDALRAVMRQYNRLAD